eukprot:scaffold8753_cov128-Isochrysis_galbana.AAC.2
MQRAHVSCRRRASSHQTDGASASTTSPAAMERDAMRKRPWASECPTCTLPDAADAAVGGRVAGVGCIPSAPKIAGREIHYSFLIALTWCIGRNNA